jgi:glucan phosphoethanolaminetransferase (alkaline phosphatase superfamily)
MSFLASNKKQTALYIIFAVSVFLINTTKLEWPLKILFICLALVEALVFTTCFVWLDELERSLEMRKHDRGK